MHTRSFVFILQSPNMGSINGININAHFRRLIQGIRNVHRIFERYFNGEADLNAVIAQETKRTKLAAKVNELEEMLRKTLEVSLGDFCLKDVKLDRLQTEMEFFYETPQGWMKGYIDLCFEHEGKLYVVDWKTNLLGSTSKEAIFQVMQAHDYLLQAEIYSAAMHKYLAQFRAIGFGGVYFVFVRGAVVYRV